MKHRTSQILYSYWDEVRQGRLAPRRFDIEPARIASILAETMILEHTQQASYRFRLAGTRVVDQLGMELRGTDFIAMWRRQDAERVAQLLARLASHGGCGVMEFDAHFTNGQHTAFEAVLLPLVHTHDVIDRYLGAISCGQPLHRAGEAKVQSLSLVRLQTIGADVPGHHEQARLATQEPPVLDPRMARGRIVRSERRQFRVLDGGLSLGQRNDS